MHQIPISDPLSAGLASNVVQEEEGDQDGDDDSVSNEEGDDDNVDQQVLAGQPTFASPVDDIHSEEDKEEEQP